MFEAKDVIGDAVKRAVDLFAGRNPGDVVPWEAIEAAAGFDRESPHWTQFLKRTRRDFRKQTGIVVWSVKGIGLKLQTVEEQVHNNARVRRAHRQIYRSIVEIGAVLQRPETSPHQRAIVHRKIEQQRATRKAVLYSSQLAQQLARPSNTGMPKPTRAA